MAIENLEPSDDMDYLLQRLDEALDNIDKRRAPASTTKTKEESPDEVYSDVEKVYSRLKIYKDRPDISMQLFNRSDDDKPFKEIIIPKKDVRQILEYLYR